MRNNDTKVRQRKPGTAALKLSAALAICVSCAPFAAQAQTESVIYNFTGKGNGDGPVFGYTIYKSRLYGTLESGGSFGLGEVYKLTPPKNGAPWRKTVLHSFGGAGGADTAYPAGRVVADSSGNLYGTTASNADGCCGVIYQVSPPAAGETNWTENIIYKFTGGIDGDLPYNGLSIDANGALYGVTHFGGDPTCLCGTVFMLHHNIEFGWILTVLYKFQGGEGGSLANDNLLIDPNNGMIFGTTQDGGANNVGRVYSLTPPDWTYSTVYDFQGAATGAYDGATPNGQLAGRTGDLWGTTQSGGASENCCGMVFELRQEIAGNPYTEIKRHNFTGGPDGAYPYGGLFLDTKGIFWGTTYEGGSGVNGGNLGTIFEFYPYGVVVDDYDYKVAYSFQGGQTDGQYPRSAVVADDNGSLYGTTIGGGTGGIGVAYKFVP